MRLINVNTMELKEFFDNEIPPYAILSHRWGKDEVTFQDYAKPESRRKKAGYGKIKAFCRLAKEDGHRYAWVDTCCIDKTSSAELSEAINSMFAWYRKSKFCYAYLSDVTPATTYDSDPYDRPLRDSNWFTRGWTLQELLAPYRLGFYDKNWQCIGERHDMSRIVQEITGINERYLRPGRDPVFQPCVAEKFSWASQRKTSRTEDMAYCLLGLLDVNMPLLYGEGHKAFRRLQEEFMRTHLDLTLLTWGFMKSPQIYMDLNNRYYEIGCLANTVTQFQRWNNGYVALGDPEEHHTTTNAGLLLGVKALAVARIDGTVFGFIPLDSVRQYRRMTFYILAIPLVWQDKEGGSTKAQRADGNGPFWVPEPKIRNARGITFSQGPTYLVSPSQIGVNPPPDLFKNRTEQFFITDHFAEGRYRLDLGLLGKHGYYVADFYPPNAFRGFSSTGLGPEGHALLRFTHPKRRDVFLLLRGPSRASGGPTLWLGIAPESCTTWEHLLKPDYDKISFRTPVETFSWFSKVGFGDLNPFSVILIHVEEDFDEHGDSSIQTHVSLRVIEYPSDYSD